MTSDSIEITCPSCGFKRTVPLSNLPSKPVKATCPKCGNSFSFDRHVGMSDTPEESPETKPAPGENNVSVGKLPDGPGVQISEKNCSMSETSGRKDSTAIRNYYISRQGKQAGPFEKSEVLWQFTAGFLSPDDLCRRDGMADWESIGTVFDVPGKKSSPTAAHANVADNSLLFLYVPVSRLILLSIVSFSIYEAYWVYKNWRYVKERDNLTMRPFWRGWFGIFYCHSLLRRIHEDKEARSVLMPSFSPSGLASGWVVLVILGNLVSRAPSTSASVVSAFIPSFLCLVPVQSYINDVTEHRNPGLPYYRWSSGHIVCLVIGIIIWALLLIGLCTE